MPSMFQHFFWALWMKNNNETDIISMLMELNISLGKPQIAIQTAHSCFS